jgi:uncharacterized cupredoxin-like copper-binding protein
MVSRWRWVLAAVAALALLAGCGSSGSPAVTATTKPGSSAAGAALGGPGDPGHATRTVTVTATDDHKFSPDTISAKVGETITFKVTNNGKATHDFVLGDEQEQTAHDQAMAAMPAGMAMGDEPNAIHIPAGQTKSITWTFIGAGTTIFGSHEAGDYAAGMKGTVVAS